MASGNTMIVVLLVAISLAQAADFCWKDTYGRGVGTIPTECPGRDKIGLLCYSKCPSGYHRWGFDCHQYCKEGWSNNGLYCRKAEYGRGVGYGWKFSDGFSNSGMYRRCEADHGRGKCEQWGAIVYPKCKSGYSNVACCICRPATPNCAAEGHGHQIDLSCAKKVIIGDPIPMSCSSNKEKDAGLCYTRCRSGYDGVGPVCWMNKPNGWVNCGMGAATSSAMCAKIITDQVISVGEMAFNIATFGSGSLATKATSSIKNSNKLRSTYTKMKKLYDSSKKLRDAASKMKDVNSHVSNVMLAKSIATFDETQATPEEIANMGASIAALFDPTGVAGVLSAYTHPKCSTQ